MKETYVDAEMEIIELYGMDIIMTSGDNLPFVPNPYGMVYDDDGNLIDIIK